MRTVTTPNPSIKYLIMVYRSHHFFHSMPEAFNTHNGNGHFSHQTYQATETRGHAHNTIPFRIMNTSL